MTRCLNCMKEYEGNFEICPHCGYVRGTAPKEIYHLTPGVLLADRYEIGTTVGSGGFGVVYRAWDRNLDKLVAIKEYYPTSIVARTPGTKEVYIYAKKHETEYRTGLERFLEEARNMARFSTHPNIVNVYNFFEENNTAYCVMEFMDGISYKEYIKRQGGIVPEEMAVRVTAAVLDALTDIHKSGIIHRDIAPDNVMILKDGVIKLMDFGAARFSNKENDNRKLTVILKPGFAPPEQYNSNSKQGPYTDLYAVGAMLYRAVTGVMPEESSNRLKEECLTVPKELNPEISDNLNNVILRAMAVLPELRFQNTKEFKEALFSAKKVRDAEEELKRRRKKRKQGILVAAVLLMIGAGGGFYAYDSIKAETELKPAELLMWVPAEEGQEEAVQTMFEGIVEGFTETYPQIEIQVEAIADTEYANRLAAAVGTENMPDIYDSSEIPAEELQDAIELDKLYRWIDTEDYYVLGEYKETTDEMLKMPVSFRYPVLYVRKSGQETAEVDIEALQQTPDFSEEALEAFLSGETKYLLADTSCYRTVNAQLAGRYELQQVPEGLNGEVLTDTCYSISAETETEERNAAFQLLRYLLDDNAQSRLCVQSHEGVQADYGLPVYKNEFEQCLKIKYSSGDAKVFEGREMPKLAPVE